MTMQIPAQVSLTAGVSGQQQVERLNASLKRTGDIAQDSGRRTAAAMGQLPMQLNDLAVQIAGGQNPLMALFQQGTQVRDAFGGIGPAMRAIGSLITPARVAFGGLAAAVGVTTAAFVAGQMEASALSKALALSGNQAGITAGQFEAMAARIRESTGATAGNSRDLLAGAAGSGAFGPGTIESAASAMARLQRLSGQSSEEIVKDFAKMRSGVASWAAEHNRQYAYLTAATFAQIRALEQQGKTEEALRLNVEALDRALDGREVQLGTLEKMWLGVKDAASGAWDAMKGIGRPDSTADQMAALQKELQDRLARGPINSLTGAAFEKGNQYLRDQIELLRERIVLEGRQASAQAASAAAERKAIEDIQSGFNERMAETRLSGILQADKLASEARIKALEMERAEIERLQAAGLLTEQAVAERRLAIRQREIAEQQRLVLREIEIEKQRPVSGDPRLFAEQRANRLAALQGRLSDLGAQAGIEAVLGSAEATKARVAQEKAYAKEYADAWKTANDFLLRLRQQNERGSVALLADPVERARREIDIAVREIERTRDEATKALEFELLIESDPAQVERIKQQLAEIKDAAAAAVDLERAKMPGTKSWLQGLSEGFYEWRASALDVAGSIKSAFTSMASGIEDALVQWVTTGKASFKDFARSVIADITRIIIRWTALQAVQGLMGAFGGGGGVPNNYGPSAVPAFAKGGAFSNGIVSVPTMFGFGAGRRGIMGEAGPEAVVPLRRTASGDLGVQVTGSTGGGVSIGSIVVQGGGAMAQDTSGRNADALGRQLAAAVQAEIIRQQRPGGLLAA